MYKIIPAKPEHAKQILGYTTITCYWKEFMEGNLLGLDYESIMLEYFINPRIPHTNVIIDDKDESKIFGCMVAMTSDDLATMPDYTPFLHPKALKAFEAWLNYPIADSVVIELLAVEKTLKIGLDLYSHAENLAKEKKNGCLSEFCWSFVNDSLSLAIKKGFMVTDIIKFSPPVLEMPLLYLQKRPELTALNNYFQSAEYLEQTNMLDVF